MLAEDALPVSCRPDGHHKSIVCHEKRQFDARRPIVAVFLRLRAFLTKSESILFLDWRTFANPGAKPLRQNDSDLVKKALGGPGAFAKNVDEGSMDVRVAGYDSACLQHVLFAVQP